MNFSFFPPSQDTPPSLSLKTCVQTLNVLTSAGRMPVCKELLFCCLDELEDARPLSGAGAHQLSSCIGRACVCVHFLILLWVCVCGKSL